MSANGERSEMTEAVDLLDVDAGATLRLFNGATVQVRYNPRDGMWLFCQYLSHPEDQSLLDGKEHAVFAQDIERIVTDQMN